MTDRDLLDLIDAAEDEFVAEAAPQSPRGQRRRPARMIAAAACLLLAGGLGAAAMHSLTHGRTPAPTETIPLTVYATKEIDTARLPDAFDVTLADASALDFSAVGSRIDDDANAGQTNVVAANSNLYAVNFSATYEGANASLNSYSSSDAMALYNSETGKIAYYTLSDPAVHTVDGDLAQSAAVEAAETFNAQNFAPQETNRYDRTDAQRTSTSTFNGYVVEYYRSFCGYKTNDTITVNVNMDGEIVELNALNMGACDVIEQNVSAQAVRNADRLLQSLSGSDAVVDDSKHIAVDSVGDCYLCASASDGNDIYVKLNE